MMKRTPLIVLATLAPLALVPAAGTAQPYPSQDIRFISAFPPGSGSDTVMRFIADKMRPMVSRPILVENKPGAGGVIAAEHVVRSKPDGHTMFTHAGNTMASIKHLLKTPPFDPATAIQVAATINKQTFFIVVDARKPYTNLADLTAALKEKGDKATYGASANIGLIMGALYRELAGLKAVDVQYNPAPMRSTTWSAAASISCGRSGAGDRAGQRRTRAHSRHRLEGPAAVRARIADHGRARRADRDPELVRRAGAGGNAQAGGQSDQCAVQQGDRHGGDAHVPPQVRHRALDRRRRKKARRA